MKVTTAELAAALIAVFEGCRLAAYQDSGGVWTIGIGHTGGVTQGMVITQAEALQFFAADQAPLLAKVAALNLSIAESAALVSFGFNCGIGALERVIVGYSIGTSDGMPAILAYNHAGGQVVAGLAARRSLENTLIRLGQQSAASA